MLSLTSSLPYHINRVGVKTSEMLTAQLEAYGLTLYMFRVLMALAEKGDQRLGELAEMTSIEVSTLSRLVGAMHRKMLVIRDRSPDNGRTVTINLTEKGRRALMQVSPIAQQYERLVADALSPDDVAHLKRMLQTIYRTIRNFERLNVAQIDDAVTPALGYAETGEDRPRASASDRNSTEAA